MKLTDNEFIRQFEQHTLNPEEFNHIGHLRIAWLYLTQYEFKDALEKVTNGIASYAKSLGATDKFQYTLTQAIVYIMAPRMTNTKELEFSDFLNRNCDLVESLPNLLAMHYSSERLNSRDAKTMFLPPDIKPFAN